MTTAWLLLTTDSRFLVLLEVVVDEAQHERRLAMGLVPDGRETLGGGKGSSPPRSGRWKCGGGTYLSHGCFAKQHELDAAARLGGVVGHSVRSAVSEMPNAVCG